MRTIWLASYPKSGNTWMRVLLTNLAAEDERGADINNLVLRGGIASARERFDQATLIDSGLLTLEEIDALRPRVYEALADDPCDDEGAPLADGPVRFVKVHDAYSRSTSGEPLLAGARAASGAIVIVRDPRDVVPSLAHHSHIGIDEAIAFMSDDDACFCGKRDRQHRQFRQRLFGWSGHVASWLDQTDLAVHLVRYEDLQTAPVAALRAALSFAQIEASAAQIERAVHLSAFGNLAEQERDNGFREAPTQRRFFRRGESGAWRDELDMSQVDRIEQAHGAMMHRLGYEPAAAPSLACAG
jgi:aryl sulfotransferase